MTHDLDDLRKLHRVYSQFIKDNRALLKGCDVLAYHKDLLSDVEGMILKAEESLPHPKYGTWLEQVREDFYATR